MEQHLKLQANDIAELNRLFRNYKADGPARKTKQYLEEKTGTFQLLFAKIRRIDERLEPFMTSDQPYWSDNTFKNVEASYNSIMTDINNKLKAIADGVDIPPPANNDLIPPAPTVKNGADTIPNNEDDNNGNSSGSSSQKATDSGSEWPSDLVMAYNDLMDFIFSAEDLNINTTSRGLAKTHLDMIQSAWTDYKTLFNQHRTVGMNNINVTKKYMNVSGKLNDIISNRQNNNDMNSNIQFSLPKLRLPEFAGKVTEWKAFISLFDRMVHTNHQIDKGLKIEYLKTCIKGDAAKIINHIDATPENYNICYDLLRKRFDNKREILGKLIDNILFIPKMKVESFDSLKNLHDVVYESIMSINNIEISTANWDPLLTHILTHKLDPSTVVHYECQLGDVKEPQSLQNFLSYIENRFMALQSANSKTAFEKESSYQSFSKNNYQKPSIEKNSWSPNNTKKCLCCGEAHLIYKCNALQKKSTQERFDWVKSKRLCLNCLKDSHKLNDCKSKYKCKICQKPHNSLLHFETKQKIQQANTAQVQLVDEVTHVLSNVARMQTTSVLLATAIIGVFAKNGAKILLRALFDQGSQSAFLSENAAQTLALQRNRINAIITGIGNKPQTAKHSVDLTTFPRFESKFIMPSEAIILTKLIKITHVEHDENAFEFIDNIVLADPSYLKESDIDIILGASEYAQAIKMGLIKSDKNLIAQNTEFGWIISGAVKRKNASSPIVTMVTNIELNTKLSHFFNNEEFEVEDDVALTEEEKFCENHFQETCYQNENGQFVVTIPFKDGISKPDLGDSRRMAVATQLQLERRFSAKPELHREYSRLMAEAIELDHIEEVQYDHSKICNYLSHHCVMKDSTTTAVRIVYNASQKTSNGKSLNNQLAIGSIDQPSLLSLLIKIRVYKYAFTADVEKMYKQMLVNNEQLDYQRFVYRFNLNEPMREFRLKTIIFGMANAPYLAIRVLKELAMRIAEKYPIASSLILESMYMDDVLGGCHTIDDLIKSYSQLKEAFGSAKFNLRKWCSNSQELLNCIPDCDKESKALDANVKALGISWCTKEDTFTYDFQISLDTNPCTKRKLSSEIASMFDPLGWISPCIMKAKHILQLLWKTGADWDEPTADIFVQQWMSIKAELHHIAGLKIPRWINYNPSHRMQLHGFCDASEVGYAAVVYLKNMSENTVNLIIAKSKVAPVKDDKNSANVTIPRLELCGALLLTKLIKQVIDVIKFESKEVHLWTDSKIVLSWIHGNPKRFKTFVATKILKINNIIDKRNWHHVPSAENAADCASRGLLPSELVAHPIWWNGPSFLHKGDIEFQITEIQDTDCEENMLLTNVATTTIDDSILPDVSSYTKLGRIMAYVFRFVSNCRQTKQRLLTGNLTVDELKKATTFILKTIQNNTFSDEISSLKHNKVLPRCSKLVSLSPFIDGNEILRVGGRIEKANLPYDARHQVLLPNKHHITELIIRDAHRKCLHGGPKLTEAVLRENFWVTNSQKTIKSVIHKCLNCFRVNPKPLQQYMADLPSHRVNMVEKPFTNTAVDYAGPFVVKVASGRGYKTHKSYIALFVCTATKAVHLEAVSELTAEAFIAAFHRLVFRRGAVRNLYSDNGTNFVRSNKILLENTQLVEEEYQFKICKELTSLKTKWHFGPPGAPHFNGLAEAAVKSVKLHLKKTIADTKLTFEEFGTLLAQIEACVNSRPLCQLSSSPNDVGTLTPAHFLIGESMVAPPEPSHLEENSNWLNRWQRVQKMSQYFWTRWQSDYLNQLQTRTKWTMKNNEEPHINELVLIRDENTPPTQWRTARIVDLHPGQDSLIRVVSLKTKNGIIKRPITKICPLPINDGGVEVSANMVRASKTKPKRFSVLPIITAILAVCVTMSHQTPINNPVEIIQFEKSPGLYFEKTYDMYLTRANWIVLSYLHLGTLHDEFISIQNNLSTARSICYNKLAERIGCRNIISHLEKRVQTISQKDTMIFHSHGRSKRATLDVIGNIAGDLFGLAGPRFIEKHANDMRNLQKSQTDVKLLLQNHTSILEATLNVLKNDQNELEKQAQHFNVLAGQINEGKELQEAEQDLNDALLYLTQVINEFERQQQAIMHVIADSHKNLINHEILTVSQIESQVETIMREVGSRYLVPTGIEVYQISHVQSYLLDKQYVFKIVIPLLDPQLYRIYRIIPLPIFIDNEVLEIVNSHSHLMVSTDRETFQYVDNFNSHKCDEYRREDLIVCDSPRLWFSKNKKGCIWEVFNEMSYDGCELKKIPAESNLFELDNNNLLFSYKIPNSITLLCNDSAVHKKLSGQGILRIHSGCVLRSAIDRYSPLREISNSTEDIIIPSIAYNWSMALRNVENSDRIVKYSNFIKSNISQIESKLNDTKDYLKNLNENQLSRDVQQFSVIYIISTIIIIYGILRAYLKYKEMINCKPRPSPRRIAMPTIYDVPENVNA